MKRRFTFRPSPGSSIVAVIVGVGMLIFVLTFFSHTSTSPNPLSPAITGFMILWFVGLIAIIGYHLINATKRGGVPTTIVEAEDEDEDASTKSTAERLQELENLREQKLISDAEYESKRQEILKTL